MRKFLLVPALLLVLCGVAQAQPPVVWPDDVVAIETVQFATGTHDTLTFAGGKYAIGEGNKKVRLEVGYILEYAKSPYRVRLVMPTGTETVNVAVDTVGAPQAMIGTYSILHPCYRLIPARGATTGYYHPTTSDTVMVYVGLVKPVE